MTAPAEGDSTSSMIAVAAIDHTAKPDLRMNCLPRANSAGSLIGADGHSLRIQPKTVPNSSAADAGAATTVDGLTQPPTARLHLWHAWEIVAVVLLAYGTVLLIVGLLR